jgi:uncharacterized protein (TIGR00156 family)
MQNARPLIGIALLSASTLASAQYQGPNAAPSVKTAAEANRAADDTPVALEGTLARKVADETYEFKDATGTVRVEIDDEAFPMGRPVDAGTTVRLFGEVDKDWGVVEIDVKRFDIP